MSPVLPRVLNRHRDLQTDIDKAVYVGRPSKWGNPFKIGETYGGRVMTRSDVIEAYQSWLLGSDQAAALRDALRRELRGRNLACWCAPQPCHADVLVVLANTVDKSATLCETQPMPRKKRGLPAPPATAASVLDDLTAAADSTDYATVTERLTGIAQIVKAAEAQGIPVPDEMRQSVPTLAEIVAEYKLRHERKADDEKALTILRAAVLETLDDPAWNTTGTDDAPGDGFVLHRSVRAGRESLSTVLLVEKGVDPAWIAECTIPGDPYFELRVVMDKAVTE